jgi:GDA1/CD39 (nucleoside phosphatase) family
MVEMGGASTQIAFFENSRDLMANLFKLQLGASRHWNVYVHSYLYVGYVRDVFGLLIVYSAMAFSFLRQLNRFMAYFLVFTVYTSINGAFARLNGQLYGENTNINPCLPIGSELMVDSWIHAKPDGRFYPRSSNESTPYSVTMINNNEEFDIDECSSRAYELLRKEANEEWCDFEMDGNCAIAGIYQPPMPKVTSKTTEFVATSNFVDVFSFLNLGERANVSEIGKGAREICNLSWEALQEYDKNQPSQHDDYSLKQMCFRSLFVYHLLAEGWGFGDDYTLNAVDVINGQKLGWALGCMLYEINTRKYWRPTHQSYVLATLRPKK